MLIFLVLVASLSAEPCSNCYSVDELVALAVRNSPQIRSADAAAEEATLSAKAAGVWENPQIWASQGGRSVRQIRSAVTEFSIQQQVPVWGEKGSARNALMAAAQARGHEKAFNTQRVAFEVRSLAYSIASLREQRNYLSQRRARLLLVKQYLTSRTFHSPPKITESLLIQNRVRDIETAMAQVEAGLEELMQRLNLFTQLSSPPQLQMTWLAQPASLDDKNLRDKILKENFQLKAQKSEVESARENVTRTKKTQLPEISLIYAGFQESGGDGEIYHRFGLGLTIPLDGIVGWNIDAAKTRFAKEQINERWVSDQLLSEFRQTWARFRETQTRVARYPLSMRESLEKNLRRAEGNFKNGLIETLLFLQLENETYDQLKSIYVAQADHLREISYLKMLASEL